MSMAAEDRGPSRAERAMAPLELGPPPPPTIVRASPGLAWGQDPHDDLSWDLLMQAEGGGGYVEDLRGLGAGRRPWGTPSGATQLSRIRMGAAHLGITEEEYLEHCAAGEKWCSYHRAWEPLETFGRDKRRPDGRTADCRAKLRTDKERTG